MAYSMLGITDPRLWGIGGEDNGIQGFAGRFGRNVFNGMNQSMQLGTAVSNYGTSQRLAGLRESTARQALTTQRMQSQNDQIKAGITQRSIACTAIGWNSPDCRELKSTALKQKSRTCAMQGWNGPGCAEVRAEMKDMTGQDPAVNGAVTGDSGQALGMSPNPNVGFDMNAALADSSADAVLGLDQGGDQPTMEDYNILGVGL